MKVGFRVKVKELIEMLQQEDQDLEVHYQCTGYTNPVSDVAVVEDKKEGKILVLYFIIGG